MTTELITATAPATIETAAPAITIFPVGSVQEVDNYPYGRLKCKAFFSCEYKKGHGFRSVFQTINPKNDRLNAPKYSTYSEFRYNYLNPTNGHIEVGHKSWNGSKHYNSFAEFMTKNAAALQLSDDMITGLQYNIFVSVKMTARYVKGEAAQIAEILGPCIKLLADGINNNKNIFPDFYFPLAELQALDPTYCNY